MSQYLCCSQCPQPQPYHRDPFGSLTCPGCGHTVELTELELDPGEYLVQIGVFMAVRNRPPASG